MISLQNVEKIYRTSDIETIALENVNLSIEKGEFVSIMGPSGCGKSTLLNIIGLLDKPTEGHVMLLGEDMTGKSDRTLSRFRNENLGFIFQSFHLIPSLNVMQNVALPLTYRNGESASERRHRVKEILEKLGLGNRLHHFPSQLSGGQCQRVAIARAIAGNPEIILADEPTGNLDSQMGSEVMDLLHKLNYDEGRTIVMVTHNEEQARQTDRIIRFFDGRQIQ
ncbi:MAG: ABC transporter ATP-binding protein [Muribaculaceae bacterium]|nr:ABC transporter ATP-binding protein [Muribaculaceae bacterium]